MKFSNVSFAVPLFAAAMLTAAPAVFAADPAPAQTQTDKSTAPKPAAKTEKKAQPATDAQKTDPGAKDETATDATKPLVSVNVAAVRDSLATQLAVSAPLIPDIIMAEPAVAAEACSMAANDLETDLKSDGLAKCTAITTSQSLRVAVQKKLAESSTTG